MSFSLHVVGRQFMEAEIVSQSVNTAWPVYAQQAYIFCQKWLLNEPDFQQKTSGSTGEPKIITLKRGFMQASAKLSLQSLSIEPGSPAVLAISPDYIGGKMVLVRAMLNSSPVWVTEPSTDFYRQLPKLDNYWTSLVPLQAQALVNQKSGIEFLRKASVILLGGATVPSSLADKLVSLNPNIYSSYGMTETCSHIALRKLSEDTDVYETLAGVKIFQDERACLAIEGPMVAARIQTNDIVEILDRASFRVLGRADNIINSGAVKISPERVEVLAEAWFGEYKISAKALGTYRKSEELGQEFGLLIEIDTELSKKQQADLLAFLKKNLPRYWEPKFMVSIHRFSYLPSGKIDRSGTRKSSSLH
jgi:O-succinylbenzoic acid--CoA ligase